MCALVACVVCASSVRWGILFGESAHESSWFPAVPRVLCPCRGSWAPSPAPLLNWARAGEPEQSPQGSASASCPPPVLQDSAPASEPATLTAVLSWREDHVAMEQEWGFRQRGASPRPLLPTPPSRCRGGPAARVTGHNVSTRPRLPARGPVEVSTRAEEEQGAAGLTQRPKSTVRLAPPPGKAPRGSPGSRQ